MDMVKLFENIADASFIGSILILIIILAKVVFKEKLNSYFHYYIWTILIIKLIMPYSIHSNFSIFTANTSAVTLYNSAAFESSSYIYNENGNTSYDASKNNLEKEIVSPIVENNRHYSDNMLVAAWLLGSSIMIILVICCHFKIRHIIKKSRPYHNSVFNDIFVSCVDTVKAHKRVKLIYTNRLQSPALYGIINPTIIIPLKIAENIDSEEFRYIVLHELSHLKRKDIFLNWIITLLQCIYWFNPIVLYGLHKMKQDCELACDQHVISYLKNSESLSYGNTLIKMLQLSSNRQWIPGATSLSKSKFEIKRRIIVITKYKKLSFGGIVFGGILIALIGFIGITNGITKSDYFNNTDIKTVEDISEKSTKSITITLSDNMEEFNNNRPTSTYPNASPYFIVSPGDVNNVTNELKKLGAENINVNGEQITEKSEIKAYAQFVDINGKKYTSPFIIKAEWKENILENSLMNNSVINDLKSRRKIIVDINKNDTFIYNVVKETFLTNIQ